MIDEVQAPSKNLGRAADLLKRLIRETDRFDSAYDKRIRDLAVQALALVEAA